MCARYAAYVLEKADYLLRTWHASTRPAALDLSTPTPLRWLGLKVIHHDTTSADRAHVEFITRFKQGGRASRLHEFSRFVREGGCWYYVDGEFPGE